MKQVLFIPMTDIKVTPYIYDSIFLWITNKCILLPCQDLWISLCMFNWQHYLTQLSFSKLLFNILDDISCRWSSQISSSIEEHISEENLIGADAWDEIKSVCCQTVKDFKMILSTLEDFKTNELCVDQKKRKHTIFGL